jgi:hypothetical protein
MVIVAVQTAIVAAVGQPEMNAQGNPATRQQPKPRQVPTISDEFDRFHAFRTVIPPGQTRPGGGK